MSIKVDTAQNKTFFLLVRRVSEIYSNEATCNKQHNKCEYHACTHICNKIMQNKISKKQTATQNVQIIK